MSPQIGEQDDFESIYTEKFRSLAKPFGEFIKYERDRAAIDIGLHLTERVNKRFIRVSNTRVWFQLKGIRTSTLPFKKFNTSSKIPLDLKIEDLRFWYASPEAVYLVVYIECANVFLAEDIRNIIDRQWGENIFSKKTFREGQKTARVRISKSAQLNDDLWKYMLSHHSLRIDGPSFRGRPLGHRLDPFRCIPNKMDPPEFLKLITRLLSAHGYEVKEYLDPTMIFPGDRFSRDMVDLTYGIMNYTFEYIYQMSTQFVYTSINGGFRVEGQVFTVQGPCAVLVICKKKSNPERIALKRIAQELSVKNIKYFLVFVNDHMDPGYFGDFFAILRDTDLKFMGPLFLNDLAYNLLTATTIYLDFRDKISWRIVGYLSQ